jgi:hypothetical protein
MGEVSVIYYLTQIFVFILFLNIIMSLTYMKLLELICTIGIFYEFFFLVLKGEQRRRKKRRNQRGKEGRREKGRKERRRTTSRDSTQG